MPKSLLEPPTERVTVLYDGKCRFCRWSAIQLRWMDRHHRLELVPYQHATQPQRPELAEISSTRDLAGQIHVVRDDGRVAAGGAAVLEILDALPGGRLLRPWALLPGMERLADVAYHIVAGRRALLGELLLGLGIEASRAPCDLHRPRRRGARKLKHDEDLPSPPT